jgi:NAD+ synthase (glutamine-hydrolysing)
LPDRRLAITVRTTLTSIRGRPYYALAAGTADFEPPGKARNLVPGSEFEQGKNMKLAALQINPTVGDLEGNAALIAEGVRLAKARGADLAVTPELALLGYLPRDLLLNKGFIGRSWEVLERLAADLAGSIPVLVGLAQPNDHAQGRPLFNVAAFVHGGRVGKAFRKTLLPTYDVFDEDRYFEPGSEPQIFESGGLRLGISICEDVWNDRDFWQRPRYHTDPIGQLVQHGARVLVNLSASPFTAGKQRLRETMLARIALKNRLPVVYVNQVGGDDDLVFDGRSCAFDANGALIARGKPFEPDLVVVDLDAMRGHIAEDDFAPEAEIWKALVLGTRDYVRKCGFARVLLGLSGGIDSSLTAVVAAQAVGPENVLGVLMPSPYSSPGSIEDAQTLARGLHIRTLTLPISSIMRAYDRTLREAFTGFKRDLTEENIQARIRGNLLMALSNKSGAMLLTTGNKSELAVGYCTLYGDMSGGLAVISDVPKTMVYRVARWLNRGRPIIPEAVMTKAPSAELRPNQTDQDALPPYDVLDEILQKHVEKQQSADEIIAQGYDRETVKRIVLMVKTAEFKRKQAAPGIKVTDRAFGTGWRMPIARKAWDLT